MELLTRTMLAMAAIFHVHCDVTYETQVNNYFNFLSLYNYSGQSTVDMIPLANMSARMGVTVKISLYAINDFDEVAGHIDLVTALEMTWTDEIASSRNVTGLANQLLLFDSSVFNITDSSRDSLFVPYDKLWTPTIVLLNSVDKITSVGGPAFKCRYNMSTGEVVWKPRNIISGACSPNVKYFPFDHQECVFTYVPWGYGEDEVYLSTTQSSWDLSNYEPNGEWKIEATSTETYAANGQSHIRFRITIERLSLYFVLNIVLPVGALSVLNSLVFLLPPESGERVGFSTTCFLSFVVLLDIIMSMLPRSSSPISLLCYYIVVMMTCSGLVAAMTILNLRVFHSPEKHGVPAWLQKFMKFWMCQLKYCKKQQIDTLSVSDDAADDQTLKVDLSHPKALTKKAPRSSITSIPRKFIIFNGKISAQSQTEHTGTGPKESTVQDTSVHSRDGTNTGSESNEDEEIITWPMVGSFLDRFFFIVFLVGEAFFTVTFIAPLAARA